LMTSQLELTLCSLIFQHRQQIMLWCWVSLMLSFQMMSRANLH
jgi:hypothetical protein